jgi:hypothetical protein
MFTGKEIPKEVIQTLTLEGWWTWEDLPNRLIMTDGTSYWKISKFPSRPTDNLSDKHFDPESILLSTPGLEYILSTSPTTFPVYKS